MNPIFTADSRAIMRFGLRNNSLYVNRAAMNMIGNKPYVQFLWDEKTRTLLLAGIDHKVRDSFDTPRVSSRRRDGSGREYRFQRRAFADAITLRMNWDRKVHYKVAGEYNPHIGMVSFHLDEAWVIGDEGGSECCPSRM